MPIKYIFVTGGVVSGVGKGITAASLGRLLKCRGLKVIMQKFDPYINIDPGAMEPYEHGEVFVTDDGAETDLDIGHYERFVDENLSQSSSVTTGKIYRSVIDKERKGDYSSSTVQVIPHITNEIKSMVYRLGKEAKTDVVITEIGGTVGDIESLPFLEAIRQVCTEVGKANVLYIHVTLVPYLEMSGEIKTKPTQNSVKELRSIGIQPDIIVCRTEKEINMGIKDKISLFCNIKSEEVIQNIDTDTIYEVPILLENQGLSKIVCEKLKIDCGEPDLKEWKELIDRKRKIVRTVKIALVGKYIKLHDAYLSTIEALNHGGIVNDCNIKIRFVNSDKLTKENIHKELDGVQGIIVPGEMGSKCIEGRILAIKYARENKVPFFGICLGMQALAIEFARNVAGLKGADSTEFEPNTIYPIVHISPYTINDHHHRTPIRLGLYPCELREGSLVSSVYNKDIINERHRHAYELNNDYKAILGEKGLVFSGISPDRKYIEIIEIKDHPWFVGVEFHPEFKSRPNNVHPLFKSFIAAAIKN